MRIALVHSFYRSATPSGENQVVKNQFRALEDVGHEVDLISVFTDDANQGRIFELSRSIRVVTGLGPPSLTSLEALQPDIVHIHNTFPNFGWRSIAKWQGPIVHTLHNFRPICAAGTLFRDDHACQECVGRLPLPALRFGCYHDSRIQTVPLALRNSVPAARQGLLKRADAIVVGSERARAIYERAGLSSQRLHVIPNGVEPSPGGPLLGFKREGWVVAARLEKAKGVLDLLHDWPPGTPLAVFGTGPQQAEIERACTGAITYEGQVTYGELRAKLARSLGLLMPSKWLEMNPTIVSDALALGTPIVALTSNVAADLVDRYQVGATYTNRTTLREALHAVTAANQEIEQRCLNAFETEFSFGIWAQRLTSLYQDLVAPHR
jgi:glycosyltransferase involved in cell wall biosynthesis